MAGFLTTYIARETPWLCNFTFITNETLEKHN